MRKTRATLSVMAGLVPATHVVKLPETFRSAGSGAAWMTGTSPVMTASAETSPLNIDAWER
jgi:hypothetical protein